MDSEKKEDSPKEFGKVVGALHNKAKLASLRTYQGDMAEFIKDKNESVITIAVKEKERKEKAPAPHIAVESFASGKEEKLSEVVEKPRKKGSGTNIIIGFLSVLLIAGGAFASWYLFKFTKKNQTSQVVIKTEIIPYNNLIALDDVNGENIGKEFAKLSPKSGINIIEIADKSGLPIQKTKDLFDFLKISAPDALKRTLKDDYAIGIISQNKENSVFLVVTVDDFGRAFSAMLEWEGSIAEDLAFISTKFNSQTAVYTPAVPVAPLVSTSTATTSTSTAKVASTTGTTTVATASSTAKTIPGPVVDVIIPIKQSVFSWKDIIIKNKDTRGLVNQNNQTKIVYTFLDKNTLLITNSISAIGDFSSAYAARSVAR